MRFIGFALAAFSLLLVVGAVSRLDQSRDLSNNKYRLARGLVVLARQDDTTEIVPTETAVIIETEVPEPTGTGLSTTEIDPFAPTEIATASVPVETETAIDSFAPTEILTTGIPEDTEIESSEVDTVITTTTPTDEFTTTTTTSTRVVPASTTRITTPPPTAARSISTTQAVLFPPNGSDATLSVSSPTSSAVGDSDAGAPASHVSSSTRRSACLGLAGGGGLARGFALGVATLLFFAW